MYGRIVLGILLVVVLIVGIVGVGGYAYNLGVAQGLANTGKLDVPPTTAVAPFQYFGMPYFYRPFGFGFSFLGCLIPLFFFFVFFGLLRAFVWGPRWGWRGMHHRHWEGDVPPMAEEWHKKMHEQQQQPTQKD